MECRARVDRAAAAEVEAPEPRAALEARVDRVAEAVDLQAAQAAVADHANIKKEELGEFSGLFLFNRLIVRRASSREHPRFSHHRRLRCFFFLLVHDSREMLKLRRQVLQVVSRHRLKRIHESGLSSIR